MARGAMLCVLVLLAGCQVVLELDKLPPPGGWTSVAAGAGHTCAIRQNGTLWCWGRNDEGQLGLGNSIIEQDEPTQVGDATWSAISSGGGTSCGIERDGTLWCWGLNTYGTIGNGTAANSAVPVHIGSALYTQVSAGENVTCAIDASGTLSCWGYNADGELGTGDTSMPSIAMPVAVKSTLHFTQVSVGGGQSCAIATDGTLWCWGYNAAGAVGNDGTTSTSVPVQIGSDTWASVSAGDTHTCGVTKTGHLRCWGDDTSGAIGDGLTQESALVPAPTIYDDDGWRGVGCGTHTTCGIRSSGAVWCWGADFDGQLAIGVIAQADPVPTPTAPQPPGGVAQVSLGGNHTCVVTRDAHLWCAGMTALGALGTGAGSTRSPEQVAGTWTAASVVSNSTCAIDDHGGLSCWGDNTWAQLGNGNKLMQRTPAPVPGTGWTAVSIGDGHTCGLQGTTMSCWGLNAYGELGDGTQIPRFVPQQVELSDGTPGAWAQIASAEQTCAIDTAGALWCWGYNGHGELGTGAPDGIAHPVPTQVAMGLGTWTALATGATGPPDAAYGYTCGVLGGIVQCFGDNPYGELGDGTTTAHAVPAPTMPSLGADQLTAGAAHALLVTAGTAWGWGANSYGEVGDGSMTEQDAPVALGKTGWLELAAGDNHSCGVAGDHTLWCWGYNGLGQLGTGVLDDAPTPKQVGTSSHWQHVWAGTHHTCALDDQHGLWCWGSDAYGQLGDGAGAEPAFVEVQVN